MPQVALVIVDSSQLFSPGLVVGYWFERLPIGSEGGLSKSGWWRVLPGSDLGFESWVSPGARWRTRSRNQRFFQVDSVRVVGKSQDQYLPVVFRPYRPPSQRAWDLDGQLRPDLYLGSHGQP